MYFDYDGFKISYEERGRKRGATKRPFVLIHGLLLPRIHHYAFADFLVDRGNRIILVDLLGHGQSDQPDHSRHYTMEQFGRQVIALLDHLDISEAVVGGTSLGANVSLEAASHAPDRVKAMFIEMPVLERAAPAAGAFFIPLVMAYSQASGIFGRLSNTLARVPRGFGLYTDVLLEVLSREPEPSAAVLHGLLTGRLAPHPSDREKFEHEALIIGHGRDLLHPFSDAEALHRELRNSELIQASSFFQLRFPPNEPTRRIAAWLDDVWS